MTNEAGGGIQDKWDKATRQMWMLHDDGERWKI